MTVTLRTIYQPGRPKNIRRRKTMTYNRVLTDTEQNIWLDLWHVDNEVLDLGTDLEWSVTKMTLKGGLQDGVDVIIVDNGAMSFSIVPTRGMGIWTGLYNDFALGWESPVRGPVHPSFVDLGDRAGLGWLSGFDEWVVRCGLDSNGLPCEDVVIDYDGEEIKTQLTLHGKIANIPAWHVEVTVDLDEPHTLSVSGIVDETMLFGPALRLHTTISTELGSNELTIQDEVENLKTIPAELELLYHCNYGMPLLGEGSRLVVPVKEMSPRDRRALADADSYDVYRGAESGYVQRVYYFDVLSDEKQETCVLLKNAEGDKGSYLCYSTADLPCFTVWKNTAALDDGYVTGLEPGTDYPNERKFEREQGRVVSISPRESYLTSLTIGVCDSAESVREIEGRIASIRKDVKPLMHGKIVGTFSPLG